MISKQHNILRAASGTLPAAGRSDEYAPLMKARTFFRAALRLEHPLYAVAMEGLFGGFDLPEKLERSYVEMITGGCDSGRLAEPEDLRFILDRYLWAKKGYERVKGTCQCGCGAYNIGLTPSYMLAHYRDIAQMADANPKALAPGLVKAALGRISGMAGDLLIRGLPIPEKEEAILRGITALHGERYAEGGSEPQCLNEAELPWSVVPCSPVEYSPGRRLAAFIRAALKLENPSIGIASEGLFGGYELSPGQTELYRGRIQALDSGGIHADLKELLKSVENMENACSSLETGSGETAAARIERMESLRGSCRRIVGVLDGSSQVLNPRLSAALRMKMARIADGLFQDYGGDAGGLGRIVAGIYSEFGPALIASSSWTRSSRE